MPLTTQSHLGLIAARMEQARWERGISVVELARRVGVDRKRLWRVLNGERAMRADEFVRLCAELEVGLGAFIANEAPARHAEARPAGGDASRGPW
ncbi:helix-turn-helix domain-containing protein [Gordonibacter urolithinfaciens]|uniref:helix-turn-helix domain-containing protein n=1 Tax=Gordonibacter urolithinfaciens TaxID=1335613 RepID=UPI00194DCD2B|nr:helix-turn-helix transcriptional regulator [Gordonibacter urolithinfaciens]